MQFGKRVSDHSNVSTKDGSWVLEVSFKWACDESLESFNGELFAVDSSDLCINLDHVWSSRMHAHPLISTGVDQIVHSAPQVEQLGRGELFLTFYDGMDSRIGNTTPPTLAECEEELSSAQLFDLRSTVHNLVNSSADQWVGMHPAAPNVVKIYAQIRTVYSKELSIEALQTLIAGPFEAYFKYPRSVLCTDIRMITYSLAKLHKGIYRKYVRMRNEIPLAAIFEQWITSLFMLFESRVVRDEIWEAITREPRKDFMVALSLALQLRSQESIMKCVTPLELELFLTKQVFGFVSDATAERELAYEIIGYANMLLEQNQAFFNSLRTKLDTESIITDDRVKRRAQHNTEIIGQSISKFIAEVCSIFSKDRTMPRYLAEEFVRLHLFLLDLSKTIASPSRHGQEQLLSMFSLVKNSVSTICWFVITETSRCIMKSKSWLANVISEQDAKRVDFYFETLRTLLLSTSNLSTEFQKLELSSETFPGTHTKSEMQSIQEELNRLISQYNEINRAAEEQTRKIAKSKPQVKVATPSPVVVPPPSSSPPPGPPPSMNRWGGMGLPFWAKGKRPKDIHQFPRENFESKY
eukprot:TRINITY_DN35160_c0_g1_i1.p2 TRINITY_DN35160_c0_g1~~TRINITY_DN35160_c0_g1_i1.p2  ORF type:complete len:581 (-),score=133.02 TRINITY_DN35160_c0_g1_i1:263-2005(-)